MTKMQVMGWVFIVGSILGCLAMLLSILWHWMDKRLSEIEPESGEDFASADARWAALKRKCDVVRVLGLFCLYASLLAMGIGAAGLGIVLIEGK